MMRFVKRKTKKFFRENFNSNKKDIICNIELISFLILIFLNILKFYPSIKFVLTIFFIKTCIKSTIFIETYDYFLIFDEDYGKSFFIGCLITTFIEFLFFVFHISYNVDFYLFIYRCLAALYYVLIRFVKIN